MPEGLTIDAELTPATTWRGRDAAGRAVVLKKLPADCLRGGRPHPAIALRLTRLREAPVAGLAQLIGVERVDEKIVTISEWIDGRSLAELSPADRSAHAPAARKLVEALHRSGLVHGAALPSNFILQADGTLRLIDPSPLLYDDPAVDLADVARLAPASSPPQSTHEKLTRWHQPTLAAAAGLSLTAIAAAVGWVWHVAGRT